MHHHSRGWRYNLFGVNVPNLVDLLYDTATRAGNRISSFVTDPIGTFKSTVNDLNAQAGQYNQALADSVKEPLNGPKTMALAQQMAEGYSPGGMTVWHGSPYKFTKFDPKKIGTGEGAQAFGHGLYVAENPTVAKGYAKNVKDLDSIQSYNQRLKQILKIMDEDSVYPGAYRNFKSEKGKKAAQEYDAILEMRDQKSTDPGNLYKIDLPDEHINKMLDWDKPFSQQPKNVQEALAKHNPDMYHPKSEDFDPTERGQWTYMRLANEMTQKNASNKLAELGVPGIKYLDEGSRTLGEGTKNFVIFPGNEHLLNIKDINGQPIQ
jgi:hypothetical protein